MKKTLIGLLLINVITLVYADPIMLVSDEEVRISNINKSTIQPKAVSVPGAPSIEVLSPQLGNNINSPTQIDVKFAPKNPAIIKPETFRALYGSFQIDITKRLLNVAQVSTQGIHVTEANLPKGSHKITMSVEDTEGRVGFKSIEFDIK
jgi:hypothetical protein